MLTGNLVASIDPNSSDAIRTASDWRIKASSRPTRTLRARPLLAPTPQALRRKISEEHFKNSATRDWPVLFWRNVFIIEVMEGPPGSVAASGTCSSRSRHTILRPRCHQSRLRASGRTEKLANPTLAWRGRSHTLSRVRNPLYYRRNLLHSVSEAMATPRAVR